MHSGKNDLYTVFLRSQKFAQQKISPTYTPSIPYKYLYALSNFSILVNRYNNSSVHGNIHMVTAIKVIFGFLFLCVCMGVFLYIILDLKPWRKDSQIWKKK